MIKREYFFRFRKYAGDGTGSYSERSFTMVAQSLFPVTDELFKKATESADKALSDRPGTQVLCMVFNRL